MAEICQLAGLPNACYEYIHRKKIVDAIEVHHLKKVKEQMEPLSKMDVLKLRDSRRMQPYMKTKSLANSRMEFLWQTNMIETRMNMKGRYPKDKYQCPHCPEGREAGGSLETSGHLLVCRVYMDLREGLNVEEVIEDRVQYLRRVIQR